LALLALLNGPKQALLVLIGAFFLQMMSAVFVQRRIDATTVPVGVFPTMVAAMIGFSLRGPGGLLVGVALAAMAMAVVSDTAALRTIRSLDDSTVADSADTESADTESADTDTSLNSSPQIL
jgi:predicted PurR-regulated permease PerM